VLPQRSDSSAVATANDAANGARCVPIERKIRDSGALTVAFPQQRACPRVISPKTRAKNTGARGA
jgi:hypothetical protein